MGSPDFRVWGQNLRPPRFESQGYGNLMLTSEQQAMLVEEQPGMFLPMAAAAWQRRPPFTGWRVGLPEEPAWRPYRGRSRRS
jgi:hypothetical protein